MSKLFNETKPANKKEKIPMKKICIVFDHPYTADAYKNEPHNRSFSAALLHEARIKFKLQNYKVDIIDLHKDQFDPVMHKEDLIAWRKKSVIDSLVENYQKRILKTDELMFIFPIWWEVMPAMTKGFFDKVISKGIVYEEPNSGKLFKNNFAKLQKVYLVTTMATPSVIYKLIFGNPITRVIFRGTFRKMRFNKLKWYNFSGMQKLTFSQRQKKIEKFGNRIGTF